MVPTEPLGDALTDNTYGYLVLAEVRRRMRASCEIEAPGQYKNTSIKECKLRIMTDTEQMAKAVYNAGFDWLFWNTVYIP